MSWHWRERAHLSGLPTLVVYAVINEHLSGDEGTHGRSSQSKNGEWDFDELARVVEPVAEAHTADLQIALADERYHRDDGYANHYYTDQPPTSKGDDDVTVEFLIEARGVRYARTVKVAMTSKEIWMAKNERGHQEHPHPHPTSSFPIKELSRFINEFLSHELTPDVDVP